MARTFECPQCGQRRTERLAKYVYHPCKKSKKVEVFKEVHEDEDEE